MVSLNIIPATSCVPSHALLLSPRHSRTVLLSCVTQVSVGDCLTAVLFILIHQLSCISIQRVIKQKFCSHVNNNFNNIYVSEIINSLLARFEINLLKLHVVRQDFVTFPLLHAVTKQCVIYIMTNICCKLVSSSSSEHDNIMTAGSQLSSETWTLLCCSALDPNLMI